MGRLTNRREALAGTAAGAGVMALGAATPAASAAKPSVRGTWRVTPNLPPGVPPFVALAAFAAGGVFITTGSDEPGTGVGSWESVGARGFKFSYTNFHFDSAGTLSSIVEVRARGTFRGSRLRGRARLRRVDPAGNPVQPTREMTFTGRRIAA